jgi:hypothetical protein
MSKRIPPVDRLPVLAGLIERRIYLIRDQKVMIDSDLADLYQVETRAVVQAVKRNADRFPEDFMFQLSSEEGQSLRSQIVISNVSRGGRRYLPYAFTEHGVAMLSSVLNSSRAVQMNILIIRAFVRLRALLATHRHLANKIEKLETGQRSHTIAIGLVAKDVQSLSNRVKSEFKRLKNPRRRTPRIGFVTGDK